MPSADWAAFNAASYMRSCLLWLAYLHVELPVANSRRKCLSHNDLIRPVLQRIALHATCRLTAILFG